MQDFVSEIVNIFIALFALISILFLVSIIMFLYFKVSQEELSDQFGWKNFAKPIIGFSAIGIPLLGIILIILLIFTAG